MAFRAIKRRFFFEHAAGDELFHLVPYDEIEFEDLLTRGRRAPPGSSATWSSRSTASTSLTSLRSSATASCSGRAIATMFALLQLSSPFATCPISICASSHCAMPNGSRSGCRRSSRRAAALRWSPRSAMRRRGARDRPRALPHPPRGRSVVWADPVGREPRRAASPASSIRSIVQPSHRRQAASRTSGFATWPPISTSSSPSSANPPGTRYEPRRPLPDAPGRLRP